MIKKLTGMDTTKKSPAHVLDFASFIKEYFTEYKFDAHNEKVIGQLGLWAIRSPKFNGMEHGWHIDRGILLMGVPGVGKDELMRLLRKYLSYLRSPYGYGHRIVWQYAKEFQKDKVGYSCFDGDKGNLYYEELALTDENTGEISREHVQHYGNKLLIGREIIQIRYNQFKDFGWQTHFSTNCNDEMLTKVYGERAMDRLYEMCNFIVVPGRSKRGVLAPTFIRNTNQATPPAPRETTLNEHEENKRVLEMEYQKFLQDGTLSDNVQVNYYLLRSYNCDLGNDDDMRLLMELCEKNYLAPLKRDYVPNKDDHKRNWVWGEAMKMAVGNFYQKLKEGGSKSIFGEVSVNIDSVVNKVVNGKD